MGGTKLPLEDSTCVEDAWLLAPSGIGHQAWRDPNNKLAVFMAFTVLPDVETIVSVDFARTKEAHLIYTQYLVCPF
jgi:hypothetical protein